MSPQGRWMRRVRFESLCLPSVLRQGRLGRLVRRILLIPSWEGQSADPEEKRGNVSHALLQQRKAEAGSIARVPAPEIEALVLDGVRKYRASIGEVEHPTTIADRDLIERHVDSVIVKPQALEVRLVPTSEASVQTEEPSVNDSAPRQLATTAIMLAWTAPSLAAVKGIVHAPCAKPAMKPESRDALLTAIVKARGWIDDVEHRAASFAEIAAREGKAERHIRLLAPLAFVSPRIIVALID